MSYVLRHAPHSAGLTLDAAGWVGLHALADALGVTCEQLEAVVRTSDKQRYALSDDGQRIRANQGHSVDVDLGHESATPPDRLYHGTVARFLDGIRSSGLVPGSRHHVHLSPDVKTAKLVGSRRGKPVVLGIRASEMVANGHVFYVTPNRVWLAEHVPSEYIIFND